MRLIAVASGMAAAGALMVPATASAAAPAPHTFTASQLDGASDAVLGADVAGTAWHVDKKSNRLVVTADSRVSGADLAKIKRAAGGSAGALDIERTKGTFTKHLSGGDAIYASSWRCSAGFNVRSGSTYYFVTAGHCTIVYGMIRTTVCAEPGDSGGPLCSGGTALGLTSGGSGY